MILAFSTLWRRGRKNRMSIIQKIQWFTRVLKNRKISRNLESKKRQGINYRAWIKQGPVQGNLQGHLCFFFFKENCGNTNEFIYFVGFKFGDNNGHHRRSYMRITDSGRSGKSGKGTPDWKRIYQKMVTLKMYWRGIGKLTLFNPLLQSYR